MTCFAVDFQQSDVNCVAPLKSTSGDVSEVDANNEDQGQSCYEDDNPELIQIPSDEDFENEITESVLVYLSSLRYLVSRLQGCVYRLVEFHFTIYQYPQQY
ncbi:hypothetical protein EMCRGX_G029327 [Ephydatia muelleri]